MWNKCFDPLIQDLLRVSPWTAGILTLMNALDIDSLSFHVQLHKQGRAERFEQVQSEN
jgi:hypothetical protein